jgi:hypothetical protein
VAIAIVIISSIIVKPVDLANPMPPAFGLLAAIPILVSEVFMAWMLGAQPYVKLTGVSQQEDL